MTVPQKALDLIKQFEGFRDEAYQDSIGIWTIGYGHIKNVRQGDVCSEEQANDWLAEEAEWAAHAVSNLVTHPMTPGQFAALISFTYNLGSSAFQKSSLLKFMNEGNVQAASDEFPKWCFAGGKHIDGLLTRRLHEQKVFES